MGVSGGGALTLRPQVRGYFQYGWAGRWKKEYHSVGGIDNRSCFTCGRPSYISKDCPKRAVVQQAPVGAPKGKERVEHRPEEKRLGLNGKGSSQKKTWRPDIVNCAVSSFASCASGTALGRCQPTWRRLISYFASCGSSICNFVHNAVPSRYTA